MRALLLAAIFSFPLASAAEAAGWSFDGSRSDIRSLTVSSTDGAFELQLSCQRSEKGRLYHSLFLVIPPNWQLGDAVVATIDSDRFALDVDGSEDGVVLSKGDVEGVVAVPARVVAALKSGAALTLPGRTAKGKSRTASFDISGGASAFARFDKSCRGLRA